jgi:hypothetical protein
MVLFQRLGMPTNIITKAIGIKATVFSTNLRKWKRSWDWLQLKDASIKTFPRNGEVSTVTRKRFVVIIWLQYLHDEVRKNKLKRKKHSNNESYHKKVLWCLSIHVNTNTSQKTRGYHVEWNIDLNSEARFENQLRNVIQLLNKTNCL